MRNKSKLFLFLLSAIVGLTIYSCSNGSKENNESVPKAAMNNSDYENPIIGYVSKNDEPVLTKDKDLLLQHWNENLLRLSNIDAELDEVTILELDGEYVLQAISSVTGTYSTIGAFVHNNNLYSTTTTCTTTSCTSNNGCTPKGTVCSTCIGNCSKSVSTTTKEYLAPMLDIRIEPVLLAEYFISRGWEDQIYWEYK